MNIHRRILFLAVLAICAGMVPAEGHAASAKNTASGTGAARGGKPSWTNPVTASPLRELQATRTNCPAAFVTAVAAGADGTLYVATEDQGLFVRPDGTVDWRQVRHGGGGGKPSGRDPTSGLQPPPVGSLPDPDDTIYGLAVDKVGRLWAGTLRGGVMVFNGEAWRAYSIEEGMPGERVFAIASDPVSGDTWVATSGGLVRYIAATDSWRVYTRLDGLPSDQVYALAIDAAGWVYAGTDCAGIAMASAKDDYGKWAVAQAPERFDRVWPEPTVCSGKGLPSNQINSLFVLKSGIVLAGTVSGMAWSRDQGKSWQFARGADWADKANGFYGGKYQTQKTKPEMPSAAEAVRLLPEDYITAMAEDAAGRIWVATRGKGIFLLDAARMEALHYVRNVDYPYCFMTRDDGNLYVGSYGGGLSVLPVAPRALADADGVTAKRKPGGAVLVSPARAATVSAVRTSIPGVAMGAVKLPSPVPRPPPAAVEELRSRLDGIRPAPFSAAYLEDDWRTQGDWVGRRGCNYCVLCAYDAPWENQYFRLDDRPGGSGCRGQTGPNGVKGESLRHWVHWAATGNRRTLYAPYEAIRRQAEWDDHGEVYPQSQEGPDIWIWLTLPLPEPRMAPPTLPYYRISLYFFNKDGHSGAGRFRDYLVEIRQAAVRPGQQLLPKANINLRKLSAEQKFVWDYMGHRPTPDTEEAHFAPVLARTRVREFWGGVYKSFVVRSPGPYFIRISRNHSFNTTVSAVMTDPLDGWEPAGGHQGRALNRTCKIPMRPDAGEGGPALALWDLATMRCMAGPGGVGLRNLARRTAYRSVLDGDADAGALSWFRWHLARWTPEERKAFDREMAALWASMQERDLALKTRQRCPYSPGVIYDTLADAQAAVRAKMAAAQKAQEAAQARCAEEQRKQDEAERALREAEEKAAEEAEPE